MIDYLIPLIIVLVVIGSTIALVRLSDIDEAQMRRLAEDEDYNKKMLNMCIKAKATGVCPHCCKKCSWGTRMKDGIIYFTEGEKK